MKFPSRFADLDSPKRRGVPSILRPIRLFEWVAVVSVAGAAAFFSLAPVTTQYIRLALWTLRDTSILAGVSIAVVVAVWLVRRRRAGPDAAELEIVQPRFWIDTLRIVVALSVVQTVHLTLKAYLPVINHTNHDQLLWRLDRVIGLGHEPVALTLAAFGQPLSLHVIDLVYSGLYYFLLWGGVVVFFAGLDRERRFAFFDSFALMWQVGLAAYILLPSWGPVFTRPEIFETALQSCPITTHVQSALFAETSAIFQGNYNVPIQFFGLAAFPSLHVAVLTLFALWASAIGRWWRWWNSAMLVVILIGSMAIGYHYLVDGLAGALIAAGCVLVAKRGLPSSADDGNRSRSPAI